MGRDGRVLQPARRKILLGIGASALALWPSTLRATDTAPDLSYGHGSSPDVASNPAGAVLYEEDLATPNGVRVPGVVAWRTDTVPGQNGGPPETVVDATIGIPERGLALDVRFARNTDRWLPATHTIELKFTLPATFPHGGIDNVPGILMKASETARGVPLAGMAVKVTTLYFLIGLSAVEKDRAANMLLLRERNWIDLPMVYGDKQRAILAFAKGPEGERAFSEGFAAWESPASGKHD